MTAEETRPGGCCGKCPPIEGGGYDCTYAGNPRCPNFKSPVRFTVEMFDVTEAQADEFMSWLEDKAYDFADASGMDTPLIMYSRFTEGHVLRVQGGS